MITRTRASLRGLVGAIAAGAVAAGVMAAQTGRAPAPATATLSGVVVNAASGAAPIRGALVTIAGAGLVARRSTITDDLGRYAFANVPAGRFAVSASKAAFITSVYGARIPGRPGTPITIADGQHVRDVRIALTRGGVVSGTIRDPNGEPAMGIEVFAISSTVLRLGGNVTMMPTSRVTTDDRGMYRIFGLAPGEYLVGATMRVAGSGDVGVMPAQEIDSALRSLQQQSRGGGGAGATGTSGQPSTTSVATRGQVFAPTFYPGTAQMGNAGRTVVAGGDEHAGLNFTLTMVPTARIDGVVSTSDGSPIPRISVSLGPNEPQVGTGFLSGQATVGTDGTFRIQSVPPGRYTLTALVLAPASRGSGAATPQSAARGWARTQVVVQGSDITGIALTLRPPLRVSGRFVFEGTAPPPPAVGFSVSVASDMPLMPEGMGWMMEAAGSGPALADGTFIVENVMPGHYNVRVDRTVRAPLTGWTLRSAISNGRDLLDTGIEIGEVDIPDVVVTYTDKATALTGVLQTAAGQAATDYHVVVFTSDRTLWRLGARRIASTRPADDGRYVVPGLPPGEYFIAAVTDHAPEDLADPAWLAALVPAAVKLALAEGERKTQDLRIAR